MNLMKLMKRRCGMTLPRDHQLFLWGIPMTFRELVNRPYRQMGYAALLVLAAMGLRGWCADMVWLSLHLPGLEWLAATALPVLRWDGVIKVLIWAGMGLALLATLVFYVQLLLAIFRGARRLLNKFGADGRRRNEKK